MERRGGRNVEFFCRLDSARYSTACIDTKFPRWFILHVTRAPATKLEVSVTLLILFSDLWHALFT